ncbi:ABC transporter permease [Proteiniborus sp.]|uniref:ABC transporter permease n=1 Tax=Proteiniborus sp. TaxID=2079015 RepID=UPI0033232CF2
MKFRFEKRHMFIFLFILLLFLSQSIYLYIQDLNSSVGYEKLAIRLKEKLPAERGFNVDQISKLNRIISPDMATYYAFKVSAVSSARGIRQTQIYGVLGNFNEFNRVKLIEGSFIDENDNRLKRNVVVIEDTVAESLFGSKEVLGLEIEVYNRKFEIIGIISTGRAAIEKLIDIGSSRIYIPLNTMDDLTETYIGNVEYKNEGSNLDIDVIKDKIALIGKGYNDFLIEDLNIVGSQQRQKYDILLFVLGVYCLYVLIRLIIDIIKYIVSYSRNRLEDNYFFAMIKNGKKVYIKGILAIAGALVLGLFIWKKSSFRLYVAPDKIPDNPASITQILSVATKYITEFFNYNYAHPIYEIKVYGFLQKLSTIVFWIGLIFEILCLASIKGKKSSKIKESINVLLSTGICVIVSVWLSVMFIYLLGLPVMISMVDLLFIWISFVIVYFYQQGEYLRLFFGGFEGIQNSTKGA